MNDAIVYVVDDNADFLDATRFWLTGIGYDVRGWTDPRQAVDALARRERGERACLLLDVRMPHLSGLDVHDAVRACGAALPVIYMSGHADVPLAVQAMQKGAVTMLEKPFDEHALEAALAAALARPAEAAGHPAADHQTPDHGAADRRPPGLPPLPAATARPAGEPPPDQDEAQARFHAREARLTPRERQVLGFVIEGIYNKNIADRVGLSIKTVELYRARGMAKMQARSVAELTRMMVTHRA
ncbi:MAG: response regulator transcription factor [Lautropia sp.]